jgi:(2Fe-2S) ferredoxin
MSEKHLVVCVNERLGHKQKSCAGSGSRGLIELLKQRADSRKLSLSITEQVCLGRCQQGIAMRIAPGGEFFYEVTEQDIDTILNAYIEF